MICKSFTNNANELIRSNSNRLTFSSLQDCQFQAYCAPTYSIKYVVRGTEYYVLDKKRFAVSQGKYLVVNNDHAIDLSIVSEKKVMGFCIHLEQQWLQKMFTHLSFTEDQLLDQPFHLSKVPDFDEILYSEKENNLGKYLQHLSVHFDMSSLTIPYEEHEVYFNLARHLLTLQNEFKQEGMNLHLMKSSTKNELLKRLNTAKELIESQKGENLQIDFIAKEAHLSESHLFRSFKKAYGISPYQYFIKSRLSHAAGLLRSKKKTITDVALECGFNDLASFSKSFKKAYQQSPYQYLQSV
jgi:AraC-like DNA-binding protein